MNFKNRLKTKILKISENFSNKKNAGKNPANYIKNCKFSLKSPQFHFYNSKKIAAENLMAFTSEYFSRALSCKAECTFEERRVLRFFGETAFLQGCPQGFGFFPQ